MNYATQQITRAYELHRSGQRVPARAAYEEILKREPGHAAALHALAEMAVEEGRPTDGLELLRLAIRSNPGNADLHLSMGGILWKVDQPLEALASCDRAIELNGSFAKAFLWRGAVLIELKRWPAAAESFTRAVALRPDKAEAHLLLGVALIEARRCNEALASFDRALQLDPVNAEAFGYRGLVLFEQRKFAAAQASLDRSLRLQPHSAENHFRLGNVLCQMGQLDAALVHFDQTIALQPGHANAHNNRGNFSYARREWDDAFDSYNRAIDIEPGLAVAYFNRGNCLLEKHRLEAALDDYDRALELSPDYGDAHFNRSLALLLSGDLSKGFQEFEWRWSQRNVPTIHCDRPLWLGVESLAGKTILLQAEQGLGDTLQFCRFVSQVSALGAAVILAVQEPLKILLGNSLGVDRIIVPGEVPPDFDYYCPLMSLPLALGVTQDTALCGAPYLTIDSDAAVRWRKILGEKSGLRVGVVWSGGFRLDQPNLWAVNERRNIPLEKLARLKHPGIEFFSLQKGEPAESELARAVADDWPGPIIRDHTSLLTDFSQTAALMGELDLVISVDTATAHLAGALGKPVWLLNRFDTCWRWLLGRDDTPWYASMRLYRQHRPGDWDGVVERVRADLVRLLDERGIRSAG